jgi:hypothetical protein
LITTLVDSSDVICLASCADEANRPLGTGIL